MVGTACSACAICQVWPPYSLQTMSLPDFPPLNALRFFEAAARHGSFAAAARELRVTPASVSYRVKTVERHLGTTLFLRFAHGVRLNPQGKAYLKSLLQKPVIGRVFFAESRRRGTVSGRDVASEGWR